MIMLGGAAPGNGSSGFIAAREHFADAAGSVFRGNAFPVGMRGEETFALRERHGVRGHGANITQRSTRKADELHLDGQNRLGNDSKTAFEKQVENAHDGSGKRIFHGSEEGIRHAFADGAKSGVECGAGHSVDRGTEKLDGGGFAESAGLTLKSDAHRLAIGSAHRQALSCMKERKTESGDSFQSESRNASKTSERRYNRWTL